MKDVNVYDVALQLHVLKSLNTPIESAWLCHVNNQYVYDGLEIKPSGFFSLEDVTVQALLLQDKVSKLVSEFQEMLLSDTPPEIKPPYRCNDPFQCLYFEHCTKDMTEYWIYNLPRIRLSKIKELEERGVVNIQDLPNSENLSELQGRVVQALKSGEEYISPFLGQKLEGVLFPIHFLDFETFMPVIPRYKDTRPYHVLPFQWSCHVLHADGALEHKEYLCLADINPREEFTKTLIESIGEGSICMYSPYEKRIINQLAEELPEYRNALHALIPRLWDICDVIRENYYHPRFGG